MKNSIYIFPWLTCFLLFFSLGAAAQKASVNNLSMKVVNNQVLLLYDIERSEDMEAKHHVDLLFVDEHYNYYRPEFISGDIGPGIAEGKEKKIIWDVFQDDIQLTRRIRPELLVDFKKRGGPENALLSLLLPGLGDYFVEDIRSIGFKPYYRTAMTAGLIFLGIEALDKRIPEKIIRNESGKKYTLNDHSIINTGDIEFHDMEPWLFKGDGELFMGLGIAMWLYDIYWVYKKGSENKAISSLLGNTSFSANHDGLQVGYKVKF